MDIDLVTLIAALGGGAFGAAVGGQPSFIFTGFAAMIGVAMALSGAEYNFLGEVAFGPPFGPHIAFGGAVAAVAYAARRGDMETGRDIATPVAGTGKPDALLVGAAFGAFGYLCNQFFVWILEKDAGSTGAAYTDTIALTVAVSAVVVRLMFGRTGLFGTMNEEDREAGRGRYSLSTAAVWVGHQGSWAMTSTIGLGTGVIAAFTIIGIYDASPDAAGGVVIVLWAFSAASLILLQFGQPGPVTHHMTLPGALAAFTVMAAGGDVGVALAVGTLAGLGGALFGEIAARVFLIDGDTHIDPPAIGIFIMNTIILLGDSIF